MGMNKEERFDLFVAPKVAELAELLREHRIATILNFYIPTEEDQALHSTLVATGPGMEFSHHQEEVFKILTEGQEHFQFHNHLTGREEPEMDIDQLREEVEEIGKKGAKR